ncbi:hypothetical protein E4T80_02640 [Muribacter muris]|uniref:Uncharacterized protein n=1 Tax=Muribacter muris TaxID=67855 RepID=A0A4Y9K518_9PAST|nr:hypothetical protein [Muribacter muris]MBF0784374.1 hypothetical protein [Muribacter muris]MBF0827920.1 hypothetical protein [Muribacter muris]TFV12150.1 hypothetical protein E4T80_02640 [Muribacter muris]
MDLSSGTLRPWRTDKKVSEKIGKPIRFLCGELAGYILMDSYLAVIEMESLCQSQGYLQILVLEEPLRLSAINPPAYTRVHRHG